MGSRHSASLAYALRALNREQYKPYINEIYLYGSCTRGEQNYNSDVDIFLKLSEDTPVDTKRNRVSFRKMKSDVIPDGYTLPHVELNYSKGDGFSVIPQFSKNRERREIVMEEGKLTY